MRSEAGALDFRILRKRLDGLAGTKYWRSLDELAQTDEFQELVEREFAGPSGGWTDPVNRRQFLGLMAARRATPRWPDRFIRASVASFAVRSRPVCLRHASRQPQRLGRVRHGNATGIAHTR